MARKSAPKKSQGVTKAHPFFTKHLVRNIKAVNPDELKAQFMNHWDVQQFEQARNIALEFLKIAPKVAQAWADAAACSAQLEDWDAAIKYGKQAISLDSSVLSALDALAHAYGKLNDLENTRIFGQKALLKRDERFGKKIFKPWNVVAPAPFAHAREKNLIAFSLFGTSSKYCESAWLNVIEQPKLYPDWTCRFYIDDTVSSEIATRLKDSGAQVVQVEGAMKQWPGPMWRFAAYDDPMVERVIFRDADSVISQREVDAVAEWINSGKGFHMMRDNGSHTELILAGLWGCTRGSMPSMTEMVTDYLKVEPSSMHFADQFFLREYVWPYARTNIMQHDSLFDFMSPRPFPEGPYREDFHTGCTETSPYIEREVNRPDGTVVYWSVWEQGADGSEQQVCRYSAKVFNGKIKANIPRRYGKRINQDLSIRVEL